MDNKTCSLKPKLRSRAETRVHVCRPSVFQYSVRTWIRRAQRFGLKESTCIYRTTHVRMYPVQLPTVGLAQARPNYSLCCYAHLLLFLQVYIVDEGKMSYKSRKGVWLEVVLSCTQWEHILKACHSDPTAGHLGRTKTFYTISERYY